jgi:DNA-binding CsgD family transcriptional regulator
MGRDSQYEALHRLTEREREVLELLRGGLSDGQIAERLGITRGGASYHVSEIISKLGVANRHEAAAWPQRPPWWSSAQALLPLGRPVSRIVAGALKPSSLAAALSTAGLAIAMGSIGLVAFLMVRGQSGAGPSVEADTSPFVRPIAMSAPGDRADEPTPQIDASESPASATLGDDIQAGGAVLSSPLALSSPATPTPQPPAPQSTEPAPTPAPTANDTPPCPFPQPPPGWLFVYFREDVTRDRAAEIAQQVGGNVVPVDLMMNPIAFPTASPGPGERAEVVAVPPEHVTLAITALESYPEVTRAEEMYWVECQ